MSRCDRCDFRDETTLHHGEYLCVMCIARTEARSLDEYLSPDTYLYEHSLLAGAGY